MELMITITLWLLCLFSLLAFNLSFDRYLNIRKVIRSGLDTERMTVISVGDTTYSLVIHLPFISLREQGIGFVKTYLDGDMRYAYHCLGMVVIQSMIVITVLYGYYPYLNGLEDKLPFSTVLWLTVARIVTSTQALISAKRYKRQRDELK